MWKVPSVCGMLIEDDMGLYSSNNGDYTIEEADYYNGRKNKMGGWNIDDASDPIKVYMDRSYKSEEIAKDVVNVNLADNIEYVEKSWVTRTPLDEKYSSLLIYGMGFGAHASELKLNGWNIELVTNNFTRKTRLYLFHPYQHLLGRGEFNHDAKENGYLQLDYMGHAKEFRKRYRSTDRLVLKSADNTATDISDVSTEELLGIITARLKSETPKTKPKKTEPPSNVVDITALLERIQAEEAERELSTESDTENQAKVV